MANLNPSPLTRFGPGNTANPGGRPKNRTITARLHEILARSDIGGIPIDGDRQVADLVAETLIRMAMVGDVQALKELLNRAEGKVIDRIEHSFAKLSDDELIERAKGVVGGAGPPGPDA